jgi:hypothetical protein
MKYLIVVAFLLCAGSIVPTVQAQHDSSGKTGMMAPKQAMHGDSCKECKDGHGGMMMMNHDGGGMSRGCPHDGGMMGSRGGMECMDGHRGMHEGGMYACGGTIRMIVNSIFALLGLIALVLLIMIEMHWVRLLSARVRATKVVAVTKVD